MLNAVMSGLQTMSRWDDIAAETMHDSSIRLRRRRKMIEHDVSLDRSRRAQPNDSHERLATSRTHRPAVKDAPSLVQNARW